MNEAQHLRNEAEHVRHGAQNARHDTQHIRHQAKHALVYTVDQRNHLVQILFKMSIINGNLYLEPIETL